MNTKEEVDGFYFVHLIEVEEEEEEVEDDYFV
jgi:hypothetical protein